MEPDAVSLDELETLIANPRRGLAFPKALEALVSRQWSVVGDRLPAVAGMTRAG